MPLSFPKAANRDGMVGRTPCFIFMMQARVPLDPPLTCTINLIQTRPADRGVGCGPGGPPHFKQRLPGLGKLSGIAQKCLRHVAGHTGFAKLRIFNPNTSKYSAGLRY